jgi:K(+)-stimulated pyrophosphate-energized sodium pump
MLLELPIIEHLQQTIFVEKPFVFLLCLYVLIPIPIICSFISLVIILRKIRSLETKTIKMREISAIIQKGAGVYLRRQTRNLFIALAILFIPVGLMGIGYLDNPFLGFFLTGLIFLIGSICSLTAGYIGMKAATKANILVVEASIDDPNEGFKIAYYGGMVTGILTMAMLLLGIWFIILLTNFNVYLVIGFSFGASVTALLAQIGGGIFTKSADIGADSVGKYEMDIKEDDPNNPAVIADLIGDNVGDCAARGADLFESASADAISGMILGIALYKMTGEPIFIITNLTLISLGLFSLFITTKFLKIDFEKPSKSAWTIFIVATVFNIFILLFLNLLLFGFFGIYLFLSSVIGLLATFFTIIVVVMHTSMDYKSTRGVAEASSESPATNILSGLATGFRSTFSLILIFVIAVVVSFYFGAYFGILYFNNVLGSNLVDLTGNHTTYQILIITFGCWGVCMASASSDIIISTILSFDTFGPITDNAAGIVELGGDEVKNNNLRENLDKLDSLGNTVKAVSKGFALMCGGLSSVVLFLSFLLSTNNLAYEFPTLIPAEQLSNIFTDIHIFNPFIIGGICIGMVLPFFYTSQLIYAVQTGARKIVQEVRRQYKEIPGLKEGTSKPDYDKCIRIVEKTALRNMAKPVFIIFIATILVGVLLGPFVIAAFLIGNLISCLILGFFLCITGATFDNAKKGIEAGLFGGKGSFAHKSAIIGDTVGDPMKDTAGPSMNILIKTINTISLTFLPLFMITGFLWLILPL